jgi:plasmid stabilization system protein ParE
MTRLVYKSSVAMQDLVECATYLGEQSPGLENRFLDSVEETLDQLASAPEMGGQYETQNPRLRDIRAWRVKDFKKHLVFYRPVEDEILQ